jgi:poly-gamma-glutamate synthesis protein (capsule biosynthesis protein)
MTTEPHLLEDLKWLGINMVSCANNHAFNFGQEGIHSTIRYLDKAGITHAGTGLISQKRGHRLSRHAQWGE